MNANGTPASVAQAFLDQLFGKVPSGDIVIWTLDRETRRRKRSSWMNLTHLANAGKVAAGYAAHHEVYFGVSPQSREGSVQLATEQEAERAARGNRAPRRITASDTRGFIGSAAGMIGLWADVDVQDEGHKKSSDLPPDVGAALALIDLIGLKPSILVGSGGGVHAYWLFRTPWLFSSDEDRRRGAELSKSWQGMISALAADHGWVTDSTWDLARVLRVPGTLNHKLTTPRPVGLISSSGRRHDPGDFGAVIERSELTRPPSPKPARKFSPRPISAGDARVFDRCMAYVAKLPEAVSGSGGHDATLRVACECFRFGLDLSDAARVMEWFNATKCSPPWSVREIDHKLEDGRKKVDEAGEFGAKLRENRAGRNNRTVLTIAPLRAGAIT